MPNEQKRVIIRSDQVRLRDIVDFNPKLVESLRDDDIVGFITMSDVSNSAKILTIQERHFSDVKKGFTYFQPGDVLLAKITPCMENGKGCLCPPRHKHFFGSTEFHVLRAKSSRVLPDYIYYITNQDSFRKLAARNMKGSAGQKRVPRDFLENYPLTLPSIERQRKITQILSSVDEWIQKIDNTISTTEQLKSGLMQVLFSKGIGHTKFKRTKIGELPEEWDAILLDSVVKRGSGHTPNKQHPEYWNGGIKWVSLSDSKKLDNRYIADTDKEISMEGIKNSSAVLHPKETIVICRDAAIGKVAILGLDNMAVSQHFIAWQCGKNVYSTYLYYLLQSWKARFERIATGTTIKTIGLPFFKSLHIPLPPIDEQKKIGAVLWSIDDKIQVYKKQRETLTRLKNGLMQDLLSGNKIVSI